MAVSLTLLHGRPQQEGSLLLAAVARLPPAHPAAAAVRAVIPEPVSRRD